ncbi:MAG: anion permease [Clostridiales bacterium 43-6]|nr:MAG: anion permease [Clostridiales bacterium 43-6]
MLETVILITVILLALSFDFINGFHDTANSIATTVSTRVLTPRAAILMAATLNFIGALTGHKVAKTISSGLVYGDVSQHVIISALLAAIIWNLITWYLGIPSSSSHALIGGLVGSAIAFTGRIDKIQWDGVLDKVIIPLFTSPLIGFFVGFLVMKLIYFIFRSVSQHSVNKHFSVLQVISSAFMALSHGGNDAQKSMGIITLALFSAGEITNKDVPFWVVLACALAMALGTSVGGWKIIKTMGVNMIKLQPSGGFAAETSAAAVIQTMTFLGAPVSTTHIISTAIMGVGSAKRLTAVRWSLAKSIVTAWVVTIPVTALIGMLVMSILDVFFQ